MTNKTPEQVIHEINNSVAIIQTVSQAASNIVDRVKIITADREMDIISDKQANHFSNSMEMIQTEVAKIKEHIVEYINQHSHDA